MRTLAIVGMAILAITVAVGAWLMRRECRRRRLAAVLDQIDQTGWVDQLIDDLYENGDLR